jgi:hypothetical protein
VLVNFGFNYVPTPKSCFVVVVVVIVVVAVLASCVGSILGSVAIFPGYIFALLFYVETRRLQIMLPGFLAVLDRRCECMTKKKQFSLLVVSCSHIACVIFVAGLSITVWQDLDTSTWLTNGKSCNAGSVSRPA